jgi:hypothetical protein
MSQDLINCPFPEEKHVSELTVEEIAARVRASDPSIGRIFGAKLQSSAYAPAVRTPQQEAAHQQIIAGWPKFQLQGAERKQDADGKAWLWEIVTKTRGKPYLAFDQKKGSCVGNGAGMGVNYLQSVEAWMKGEKEEVLVPYFWLYPYGRSRYILGERTKGDGSSGGAIAEALKEGIFANSANQSLPQPDDEGGIGMTWGAKAEIDWSCIGPNDPAFSQWATLAKVHPLKTATLCTSADQVAQALRSGYPCTTASEWGGLMQCPVQYQGTEYAYLQNRRADVWPHQQVIIGWWDHPKDGELFFIQNSWSIRAHGTCPTGAPPGGYWVKRAEIDWQCRNGEVIPYSGYSGYPVRDLDWTDIFR